MSAEIDELIEKAKRCDQEEDKAYKEKTGYELPNDLKFKEDRLAKIQAAKQALEQREEKLNPGKTIDCCCQSDKGHARTISTDDKESLRQDMSRKMNADLAKAVYKKRKVIVEPVFGQIKNSGFRGFSVRGQEKVAGEFSIVCAAHNFKKKAKAIFTGLIRPNFGNYATGAAI